MTAAASNAAYRQEYLRDAAAGACRPGAADRSRGTLRDVVRYRYEDPADVPRTAFWHCRARVVGDPTRSKAFWYLTADPLHPNPHAWWAGTEGKPDGADRCLYPLRALRLAKRRHTEVLVWAEGEKDARAAAFALGVYGVSHHGGAGKATEEQAAHFRGYRGLVLVAVDRDDPGAACGLRRYQLLSDVGVRAQLVQPADEVRTAGGPCGDRPCLDCAVPCPLPSERGADLADHVAAGYGLRDLTLLEPGDLGAAAERWAAREQQGWVYGAAVPPAERRVSLTAADAALARAHGWTV